MIKATQFDPTLNAGNLCEKQVKDEAILSQKLFHRQKCSTKRDNEVTIIMVSYGFQVPIYSFKKQFLQKLLIQIYYL